MVAYDKPIVTNIAMRLAELIIVESETVSVLPMDSQSRMERARAMGFTIHAFHGTGAKFSEFDLDKGKPSVVGGYAPMFADTKKEAKGYADEAKANGGKAHVLHVLLRLRNPLVIDLRAREGGMSEQEYKRISGRDWPPPPQTWRAPSGYDALNALMNSIGYGDARGLWRKVYAHLQQCGYDGLLYVNTPGDHHDGAYNKYVVFDPKNVRSIKAAFDPSQSMSRNLMA